MLRRRSRNHIFIPPKKHSEKYAFHSNVSVFPNEKENILKPSLHDEEHLFIIITFYAAVHSVKYWIAKKNIFPRHLFINLIVFLKMFFLFGENHFLSFPSTPRRREHKNLCDLNINREGIFLLSCHIKSPDKLLKNLRQKTCEWFLPANGMKTFEEVAHLKFKGEIYGRLGHRR